MGLVRKRMTGNLFSLTIQVLDLPLSSSKHSLRFFLFGDRLAYLIVHTTSQPGIGSKCSVVRAMAVPQTRYAVVVTEMSSASQNRPRSLIS